MTNSKNIIKNCDAILIISRKELTYDDNVSKYLIKLSVDINEFLILLTNCDQFHFYILYSFEKLVLNVNSYPISIDRTGCDNSDKKC